MFSEAGGRYNHAFWNVRSESGVRPKMKYNRDVANVLNQLKRKTSIRLRRAARVEMASRPIIDGREIVLRDAVTAPGLATPLDYYENVDLPRLIDMAGHYSQVPDLFESYNRACSPVPLPNFLAALAMLLAAEILVGD